MDRYDLWKTTDTEAEERYAKWSHLDQVQNEIRHGHCAEFQSEEFFDLLSSGDDDAKKVSVFLFQTLFAPLASIEQTEKLRKNAVETVLEMVEKRGIDVSIMSTQQYNELVDDEEDCCDQIH